MSTELLQGLGSVKPNGTSCKYMGDHLLFTGYIWATQTINYIPILDCTHTFEYDITYESDAGNYFYIGFERYAPDKTTGSNNSCIYAVSTNGNAKAKQRVHGTVNLNQTTSSGNKTAFVRLRILNFWSGSSGSANTAKIYSISLREITNTNVINIKNTGVLTADVVNENITTAGFYKTGKVDCNNFYEY